MSCNKLVLGKNEILFCIVREPSNSAIQQTLPLYIIVDIRRRRFSVRPVGIPMSQLDEPKLDIIHLVLVRQVGESG